ncbi:hypothetical protein OSS47_00445 [Pseudomonas citronellolis]|uniref:hypothetical protein n=1 Tax=Pseudomonas citronellolis TaxID=53408 RepID=UPI00226EFB76|nr:hypothetical protein [Pseudomonas citronellolis]WAB92483.1 hypothetical protein OSS47_00445 [Pseudomonas citronellolis]
MAFFDDLVEEMDAALLDVLGDGLVAYLDRQGAVVAADLPVEINDGVIPNDLVERAVDRLRTMGVQKHRLQPFDSEGAFRDEGGRLWYIDGIHEDDGHLITFYVVPE